MTNDDSVLRSKKSGRIDDSVLRPKKSGLVDNRPAGVRLRDQLAMIWHMLVVAAFLLLMAFGAIRLLLWL